MEGSIRTIFMADAFSRLEYPTSWRYISDAIVLNLPPMMTGVPKSARERTKERSRGHPDSRPYKRQYNVPQNGLGAGSQIPGCPYAVSIQFGQDSPRNKAFKGTKERLCIRITPQQL